MKQPLKILSHFKHSTTLSTIFQKTHRQSMVSCFWANSVTIAIKSNSAHKRGTEKVA